MSNDKDFKVKNGIQPASYQESLGTIATGSAGYSISSTSYDSVSLDVSAQENNPTGVFFKDDGTKLYIVGLGGDEVNEYILSTAWDITTASANHAFSVSGQDTSPRGITFSPDGTKMYICGDTGDDINQYTLSTAWNLSTASYTRVFSVSGQTSVPRGIHFKTDGTKMFVSGGQNTLEYALSTAWDISTASYTQAGADVSSSYNIGLFFTSDGLTMYKGVYFGITTSIYKYTLSTAWDLSTATFSEAGEVQNEAGTTPFGVYLKPDGTKMWVVGNSTDTLYQYSTVLTTATLDLSTGSVFEITPTSNIQVGLSNPAASGTVSQGTLLLDGAGTTGYDLANGAYSNKSFSLTAQEAVPTGLFFKADGTKMYVVGSNGVEVNEFNLSTAWDVPTATYVQNFSVSAQDTAPEDLFFKPDGTKMYVAGNQGDDINEYDLSTAWDISTATFLQSFSVAAQDAQLRGLFFKPDGLKMYVAGNTGDDINEYNLSTAWNVSTATFVQAFSISSQDTSPQAVFFKPDGTKMYVIGGVGVDINEYNLSTAWNVSTASYVQAFSVSSEEAVPLGLFFKPDGYAMYIVGNTNDTVYQYSTATPATITYDSAIQFGGGTAPDSPAIGETDVLAFSTRDGGTSYQAMQAIDGAK